jgi:(p)ppGpp synthase/HD superfamily hydrolase
MGDLARMQPCNWMNTLDEGLSDRFIEALGFAARTHRAQVRKGAEIPYVSHLMAVSALGYREWRRRGSGHRRLLHDAVEDQGGAAMAAEIERLFGSRVAAIVRDCTDTDQDPKPAWRPRKEAYIASLQHKPAQSLLVSLADKVHNASTIRRDLELHGHEVWERFTGGRDGTHWYYRALADTFAVLMPIALVRELDFEVTRMETLSQA